MLYKAILTFALLLIINFSANSQCQGNLIKNGSFELDTVSDAVTATFWGAINGTPDIDNDQDSLTGFGSRYVYGLPQSSFDGGNWQSIIFNSSPGVFDTLPESFGQPINFIRPIPHVISFEFAAQAFRSIPLEDWFASIDVLINNEVVYTTAIDSTLYSFEKVSFFYVPEEKNVIIGFRINPILNRSFYKLVAIDGVCVRPIAQGRFCEP
jgi:hypothetical protein